MHSQQPLGVVQNWSALQCSKQNTEQCGDDHAPVTRGRMRAQYPLPHGPPTHTNPMPIAGTFSQSLPTIDPTPIPRGLQLTVSCQRHRPKDPMGAEGATVPKAINCPQAPEPLPSALELG